MPRRRSPRDDLEDRLAEIGALVAASGGSETAAKLRRALADPRSILAARAARTIGDLGLVEFAEELEEAYERFTDDPVKSDKGCLAKTAIIKALVEMERPAAGLYRRAIATVQREASWGEPVDTAVELRATGAVGLSASGASGAVAQLVPLLLDEALPVRISAARAIADSGREEAEAVLRFKALAGDEEPEVMTECLAGLLHVAPARSLALIEQLLDQGDGPVVNRRVPEALHEARSQAAILALGESRLEEAVAHLSREWERSRSAPRRRLILLALVAVRREQALAFLFSLLREAAAPLAVEVLEALAVLRADPRIARRIQDAIEASPHRRTLSRRWS